jgi:hypothetical protein
MGGFFLAVNELIDKILNHYGFGFFHIVQHDNCEGMQLILHFFI